MPTGEDNYFPFAGRCGFCRVLGGEAHSPNCLSNLPPLEGGDSHKKLSPHWHAGFNQKPSTAATEEEQAAYRMGSMLKQDLVETLINAAAEAPAQQIDRAIQSLSGPTSGDRTLQSLEQGLEIMRERFPEAAAAVRQRPA